MGIFDKIANVANQAPEQAKAPYSKKRKEYVFNDIPETLEAFKALPEAQGTDPFDVGAAYMLALCNYPVNKAVTIEMINYIRGPQPLNNHEIAFLHERLHDKPYLPGSYFEGSSPANNYTPSAPYKLVIEDNPYSYTNAGYVTLHLKSSGADSLRPLTIRAAGDKWCYWDVGLLSGIRLPASQNPWG